MKAHFQLYQFKLHFNKIENMAVPIAVLRYLILSLRVNMRIASSNGQQPLLHTDFSWLLQHRSCQL